MDREKVFDAFRHCMSEQKCRGCKNKKCKEFNRDLILKRIPERLGLEVLELLKEQQEIIDQYHKADAFLAVHGWKWDET